MGAPLQELRGAPGLDAQQVAVGGVDQLSLSGRLHRFIKTHRQYDMIDAQKV
jgi:hypothetical protein